MGNMRESIKNMDPLTKLMILTTDKSFILQEIDEIDSKAKETLEKTKQQEIDLRSQIKDAETKLEKLNEQGEKWADLLDSILSLEVSDVLNALHTKFSPEQEKQRLEAKLPLIIDELNDTIRTAKANLSKVLDEMTEAETTIEEMIIRREDALAKQKKLKEYIDRSINDDRTLTREELSNLFAQFTFINEGSVA